MSKVLIVYASKHGHTARIAERIAEHLSGAGLEIVLSTPESAPDVREHDVVVVGASIHAGRHQPAAIDWAKARAIRLSRMPSAFFSVCLTAADDTEEACKATRGYIDDFLDETGWIPRLTRTFAGALQYREYDFMTRLLMRLLMARGHHETDTSRDHVYTDWDAVERFADEVAAMAASRAPVEAG
jgi:menaquinone-dependent protoporphyrinogen oxidase